MMRNIIIIIFILIAIQFSFAYDIRNAKVGSTVINSFNIGNIGSPEGHAAIVVDEYIDNDTLRFIIGSHTSGVRYDSFTSHLHNTKHLGHFRAVSKNYTFDERKYIKIAAKNAIGKKYIFIKLYTYVGYFDDNIPYHYDVIPTYFRCDGLAEWATEIGLNPTNPKQYDGFYSRNTIPLLDYIMPVQILQSPIDTIGTPDAPTLTQTDTHINASFSPVSGAWSQAIYVLFRSEADNPSVMSEIYCGSERSFSDTITDDMEGRYYYALRVGERTDECGNMPDLSQRSEMSFVDINKTCKSPKLFEVVSQTDVNTSDWRVSVKNIETNETQEGVLPFNLNGSLYQLENGEWVLASCEGKTYTTTWEGSQGIYELDNPEEEQILFNRFQFNSEENLTIIDTKNYLLWDNSIYFDNWNDANGYCEGLVSDSYDAWRMPTFSELKSILNPATSNHIYEEFFTALATKPYGYWSSNTFTSYEMAWSDWLGWYLVEGKDSLVLNYKNASYISIDTKYNMNFMCVQQL